MGISLEMKPLKQIWSKPNAKHAAVFVDRDGTLIEHREVFNDEKDVVLLPGVFDALKKLKVRDYLLIGISNQPNIEKGIVTIEDTFFVNERIQSLLRSSGVELHAMYFCPHSHGTGCHCRKPEIGMFEEAERDYDIDLAGSWFIGDTGRDMEAGKRAGVKTIRVQSSDPDTHFDTKGDFIAENFSQIPEIIEKKKG
jgi:histidinol-phosphate phosphatase family protein